MCMIIYHPAGVPVPKLHIAQAMIHNPHGFGIHKINENVVYKTTDMVAFERYCSLLRPEDEFLIHCRLATTGSVKTKNCHPFYDKKTQTVFAHNGVISIPTDKDMTDSETFYKKIILPDLEYLEAGEPPQDAWRLNGSRLALYIPGIGQTLYGNWYRRKGIYYSKYVPKSKLCVFNHFQHPSALKVVK